MAIEKITIEEFISLAKTGVVMDARSPGEFQHAHFPGAYNLALFTDEERKVVGTAYKQQGRAQAIKIGLDYFGVKMRRMVEEAETFLSQRSTTYVLVHCWRGGMRSEAIAWLLDLYGFKVFLLKGGYKKFRNYVLDTFSVPLNLSLLSGYTGSGKTGLLKELSASGISAIDLESIAHHKGSAFGAIDQPAQPSQEMFENILALRLRETTTKPVWIEDESQRIGIVVIPAGLWQQMQQSPVYQLEIPFESRLMRIQSEYGHLDKQHLIDAIVRIQKRLGGLETKTAIAFLADGNPLECFRILLNYYDRCYHKSMNKRTGLKLPCTIINSDVVDEKTNIELLLRTKKI